MLGIMACFRSRDPSLARTVRAGWPALLAALLVLAGSRSAISAEWRIAKMSGDVRVHGAGDVWVKAKPLQVLKPGESVWTGRRSRAQIETDEGSVILRAGSLVKVPAQKLPEGTTVLFQGQGKVEAKVEKRKMRHFSIQTPFLAAVVKGTEFSVDIGSGSTSVSVSKGTVGAVSVESGQEVDVKAGQSISAANKAGASLGKAQSDGAGAEGNTGGGNDPVSAGDNIKFSRSGGGGMGGGGGGGGDDDDDDDDDGAGGRYDGRYGGRFGG